MHWATCSPAEFIHFLYQLLSSLIRNKISKTFSQCFQTYMNKFKPKYSLKSEKGNENQKRECRLKSYAMTIAKYKIFLVLCQKHR